MAYGEGHGGADADGGEVHDDVGELEHDFGEGFAEAEDGGSLRFAQGGEGDAEEDGEDGYLEDLAFGDGFGDVFGEDVEEEVVPMGGGYVGEDFGRTGGGGEGEADSGFRDVDGGEADDEGEGGEDFEVDEALDAHAADGLHVAVSGDAGDEGGEDEGGDDGLDEAEEDVREDAERDGKGGGVEAEFGTGEHGDEDPGGEGSAAGGVDGEEEKGEPCGGLTAGRWAEGLPRA